MIGYSRAFNELYGPKPIEGKSKMNQRIKDLWEQSTGAAVPEEGFYSSASKYNIEKFAELIVRECIDIAQDRANFPGFPPNDVNDIIDEIKEHFGVEQ